MNCTVNGTVIPFSDVRPYTLTMLQPAIFNFPSISSMWVSSNVRICLMVWPSDGSLLLFSYIVSVYWFGNLFRHIFSVFFFCILLRFIVIVYCFSILFLYIVDFFVLRCFTHEITGCLVTSKPLISTLALFTTLLLSGYCMKA